MKRGLTLLSIFFSIGISSLCLADTCVVVSVDPISHCRTDCNGNVSCPSQEASNMQCNEQCAVQCLNVFTYSRNVAQYGICAAQCMLLQACPSKAPVFQSDAQTVTLQKTSSNYSSNSDERAVVNFRRDTPAEVVSITE